MDTTGRVMADKEIKNPTPYDVYIAIKESITIVARLRAKRDAVSPEALIAIESMLDEMARNSATSVIGLYPSDDE